MRAKRASHDPGHGLGDVDGLLRSHGLRRTPQRQATLEAIAELSGHATAEQIAERVRRRLPTVSASTVYRTLGSLERVGALCHAHLGHTASVYHVGRAGLHQHLVCERCGALREVEASVTAGFAGELRRRFGFHANFTHFAVLGECRSCAARRPRSPGTPAGRRRGARH